ncbi:MAG: methyltransferase domain-containing protein [Pirellulaceae bacterium]|nr:methyltransferase domain-containing protein [Pirellulaceae bacterium]
MRKALLETLRPQCPVCLTAESPVRSPLSIARVDRNVGEQIVEGLLVCGNSTCQREFPIIDGLPILVGPIRQFVSDQLAPLLQRDDLSAATESLIGDCCGPGSPHETWRQHQSTYVGDHWGEFDSDDAATEVPVQLPAEYSASSIVRVLSRGLELIHLAELPAGPVLDLGCGPGRTTFELARRTGRLALGIDLNFALLKTADLVLREGRVRYARRRAGIAYDRRDFAVPAKARGGQAEFCVADATALPFAHEQMALVVALNLLDSIASPLALLESIRNVLLPGGQAIIASPYDWSAAATPVENWLGGHSQRAPGGGDPAQVLRALVMGQHSQAIAGLELLHEVDNIPWEVRLHERSVTQYRVHLVVVRRT